MCIPNKGLVFCFPPYIYPIPKLTSIGILPFPTPYSRGHVYIKILSYLSSDQRNRHPFQTPYVYAGISNHRGLRIPTSFYLLHKCDPRLLVTNLTSTIETFPLNPLKQVLAMDTWARVCLLHSNNLPANRDLDRRSQTKLPSSNRVRGRDFFQPSPMDLSPYRTL